MLGGQPQPFPKKMAVSANQSTVISPAGKNNKKQEFDNVPEAIIKYSDLEQDRKDAAIQSARLAYAAKIKGDITQWKDCAEMIKKDFDVKFGSTWHCIAGPQFGSFVSHESKNIIYFFIGPIGILLWKHG